MRENISNLPPFFQVEHTKHLPVTCLRAFYLAAFFLVTAAFPLHAAPSSIKEAPVWVEAVGEAVGSDFDPPKEVMERARNDAKRRAVEEAVGTFIQAQSAVSNGQLAEDLIFARVRGKIDQVQTLKEERDKVDPNLYRVTLKALVDPVYPEEGDGIRIKLELSKTRLIEGEEVKFYFQTNVDCYVYIFSIAADNSVTLLFPNSQLKDNHVMAQEGRVFPPPDCAIKLNAMCLPELKHKLSEEKIKVIATRHKEILLENGFQEGIFRVFDSRATGLVGDLARKLNQLPPGDWGEAVASYSIQGPTP